LPHRADIACNARPQSSFGGPRGSETVLAVAREEADEGRGRRAADEARRHQRCWHRPQACSPHPRKYQPERVVGAAWDQRCGPVPWHGGAVRTRHGAVRCARNDAVLTPRQTLCADHDANAIIHGDFRAMEKTLERQTAVRCTECNGRGLIRRDPSNWRTLACPACDGKGVRLVDRPN
jgi:hypothetical protein